MNRREFLGSLGLGSLLVVVPNNVKSQEYNGIEENILQALNQTDFCSGDFMLTSNYDPVPTKITHSSLIPVCPEFNNKVEIVLKAGPDGNLYIRDKDQWKRVLTS